MRCERFASEGALLVERGQADPHLATCDDCRAAAAGRARIVGALPLVGRGEGGDPQWQAKVWRRIASERSERGGRRWARANRWAWFTGGLFAAAAAAVVLYMVRRPPAAIPETVALHDGLPKIEYVVSGPALRSTRAQVGTVGSVLKVTVEPTVEVRLYRENQLLLQCAGAAKRGCRVGGGVRVAEQELTETGDYQLIMITGASAPPTGSLDKDLAAVVSAGGTYEPRDFEVR